MIFLRNRATVPAIGLGWRGTFEVSAHSRSPCYIDDTRGIPWTRHRWMGLCDCHAAAGSSRSHRRHPWTDTKNRDSLNSRKMRKHTETEPEVFKRHQIAWSMPSGNVSFQLERVLPGFLTRARWSFNSPEARLKRLLRWASSDHMFESYFDIHLHLQGAGTWQLNNCPQPRWSDQIIKSRSTRCARKEHPDIPSGMEMSLGICLHHPFCRSAEDWLHAGSNQSWTSAFIDIIAGRNQLLAGGSRGPCSQPSRRWILPFTQSDGLAHIRFRNASIFWWYQHQGSGGLHCPQ